MKTLFYFLLSAISAQAAAAQEVPAAWCSLAYYYRAADWHDDVDLRLDPQAITTSEIGGDLRGFRMRARLVTVCKEGMVQSCREDFEIHHSLEKADYVAEGVQRLTAGQDQSWTVKLKAGRFEEGTLECRVTWPKN